MTEIEVRPLRGDELSEWDEFVSITPEGTLFATRTWLEASGRPYEIWGAFRGDQLVAGLPLSVRRLPFGMEAAWPPPLTPYLSPVFAASDAKYVKTLSTRKEVNGAFAQALQRRFSTVKLSFSPGPMDLQPFIWEGFEGHVRYTYLLDLENLEDVWMGMDESRRRNIRRATKDGLTVDPDAEFDDLLALVKKTYGRQGETAKFAPSATQYHDALACQSQSRSLVTRDAQGRAIAGVYLVWDGRRAYYLMGGYDPEESHHGATALAMWEAIRFAKEDVGVAEFDFEGSMIPDIERFFRKFGGQLTPCFMAEWSRSWMKPLLWVRQRLR